MGRVEGNKMKKRKGNDSWVGILVRLGVIAIVAVLAISQIAMRISAELKQSQQYTMTGTLVGIVSKYEHKTSYNECVFRADDGVLVTIRSNDSRIQYLFNARGELAYSTQEGKEAVIYSIRELPNSSTLQSSGYTMCSVNSDGHVTCNALVIGEQK